MVETWLERGDFEHRHCFHDHVLRVGGECSTRVEGGVRQGLVSKHESAEEQIAAGRQSDDSSRSFLLDSCCLTNEPPRFATS